MAKKTKHPLDFKLTEALITDHPNPSYTGYVVGNSYAAAINRKKNVKRRLQDIVAGNTLELEYTSNRSAAGLVYYRFIITNCTLDNVVDSVYSSGTNHGRDNWVVVPAKGILVEIKVTKFMDFLGFCTDAKAKKFSIPLNVLNIYNSPATPNLLLVKQYQL